MQSGPAVVVCFWCHDGSGNFLFQRRNGNARDHQNCWDPGAGRVELGESLERAVIREVAEEYGVTVKHAQLIGFREFFRDAHNITFDYYVSVPRDQVLVNEPTRMDGIVWMSLRGLAIRTDLHPGCYDAFNKYPEFFVDAYIGQPYPSISGTRPTSLR